MSGFEEGGGTAIEGEHNRMVNQAACTRWSFSGALTRQVPFHPRNDCRPERPIKSSPKVRYDNHLTTLPRRTF